MGSCALSVQHEVAFLRTLYGVRRSTDCDKLGGLSCREETESDRWLAKPIFIALYVDLCVGNQNEAVHSFVPPEFMNSDSQCTHFG